MQRIVRGVAVWAAVTVAVVAPAGADAKLTARASLVESTGSGFLSVTLSSTKRLSPAARPRAVAVTVGTKGYRLARQAKSRRARALGTYRSTSLGDLARVRAFVGKTVSVRVVTRGGRRLTWSTRLIGRAPTSTTPIDAPIGPTSVDPGPSETPPPPAPEIVAADALAVSEGSTTALGVKLSAPPAATTVVYVASSAAAIATASPDSLTFTASDWDVAQTATVTGVPDNDLAGGSATVTLAAAGIADHVTTVTVTDDDTQSIVMDGTSPRIAEGSTAPVSVHLAYQPAADVTVATALTGADAWRFGATPPTLTFTPANYATDQTVTIARLADCSASAVDDHASLALSATGIATALKPIAGVNANTEKVLASTSYVYLYPSYAGHPAHTSQAVGVHLACAPAANVTLTATPSAGVTASPSTLTFTPANYATDQTITVAGRPTDSFGNVALEAPGYVSANVGVEYDPCPVC